MFVRFFSLTSLLINSEKFDILAKKIWINFFLLAWKFELNNYRKPLKKLVRNRKKVLLLKAEKVVLRTGKLLPANFLYEILHKNLERKKGYIKKYRFIKNKLSMNVKVACIFLLIFVSRVKSIFVAFFTLYNFLKSSEKFSIV